MHVIFFSYVHILSQLAAADLQECKELFLGGGGDTKKRECGFSEEEKRICALDLLRGSSPTEANLFHKHEESLPRAAWLAMRDQKPSPLPKPPLSAPFRPSRELMEAIHDQVMTPACQTQAEERREAWLTRLFQKPGPQLPSAHILYASCFLIYDVYLGTSPVIWSVSVLQDNTN